MDPIDPGTATATIDRERLARITALAAGRQTRSRGGAMCALEAVAYIADEPVTDRPDCASPAVAAFVRTWSDGLPQAERDALIRPLIPRLVGTAGSATVEERRVAMAADWLLRTHLPAWFHLAKLHIEADSLAELPELTAIADLRAHCDTLKRARARAAVADLSLRLTGHAVRAAAWDATHRAAWATIEAAWGGSDSSIAAATWDMAYAAAYATVRAYGKAPLEPTRVGLQRSGAELIERMIELRP